MKREDWLDDERGGACILVVLGHLLKNFIESGRIVDNQIVVSARIFDWRVVI